MNKFLVAISLLSVSFFSAFLSAETYRWVDDQGGTVYSQHPPQDGQAVETISPVQETEEMLEEELQAQEELEQLIEEQNEADEQRLADKQVAAEKSVETKHSEQQCAAGRSNLELINNRPPQTMFKMGDGQYKRFTPEERAEQINQANEAIEKYCR